MQNTVADKVAFCQKYGIEINADDWPSHHLPSKILTDRGTEFLSGPLENLCESYQVEINTLPAYRPDLKGVVEKLFDLVQSAYKPLLKGRGVVEPDAQERGAADYRQQSTLDLQQFTGIVLRCVLFLNAKAVQPGFLRTPEMLAEDIPPVAASIWQYCADKPDCPVHRVDSRQLAFALLPRAEGKITRRGLEVFHLRFSNTLFKKRFVTAGLQGRELVQVAYDPDCMDSVWLYENGTYTAFDLVHKCYTSKKAHGCRVFDIARVTPDEAGKLLEMERENIASWRDGGGQHFLTNDERREFLFITGDIVSEVPYIDTAIPEAIPRDDLKATLAWMEQYRRSQAGIDGTGEGNAEGVVIRTKDRSYIRKLRFEDYERTLRKVGKH